MLYNFNNKQIIIPDKELKKLIDGLNLSKSEAIELWLEDNDLQVNEEQEELDKKAKKINLDHGLRDKPIEGKREHKVIASDEKQLLFNGIREFLDTFCQNEDRSYIISKENKSFEVKIGEKGIKIDLIQHNAPKK